MANIPDQPNPLWPAIPLIDVTLPVLGGIDGPANYQAVALAERTEWLKEKVDKQGIGAETSIALLQAAVPLSGHRVVRPTTSHRIVYADHTELDYSAATLGVTLQSVEAGAYVKVATSGEIVEPSWRWEVGPPIFLGTGGGLTQIPPTTGFQLIVGVATSPTTMLVSIKQSIIL